jgi:hypothetical protein
LLQCISLGADLLGMSSVPERATREPIRTAPRDHMQMSFQHRRRGIVGDCRQMKVDVDSYNDSHPEAEPIQIVFDFSMDLAELEAADEAA